MVTLIILFGAMLCGYLLRNVRVPDIPDKAMSFLVWGLLFLFGISIGGNEGLVAKLHSFGFIALVVAVFSVGGCVLGAWLLWKFKRKI